MVVVYLYFFEPKFHFEKFSLLLKKSALNLSVSTECIKICLRFKTKQFKKRITKEANQKGIYKHTVVWG